MTNSKGNRAWLLAGVSAIGLAVTAGAANAQTAAPAATPAKGDSTAASTVSEVVVTGFRNSLAKAINIKRENTVEVDSIQAEDIGKFPDLNLAESLQRIPGVAITREEGEGRQITVRGLGPQYTRVQINGMEALSTVGAPDNDGGVNRTRSFDFTVFASDLFNNLAVSKTAEAEQGEGSLAATVDLHSARPFDYRKFTFIATAKDEYNGLAKTNSPRASALIADTWDNDKFGALMSLSYSHRKLDDDGSSTVRWDEGSVLNTGTGLNGFGAVDGTNCQVTPQPAICTTADSALHPRFPRYDLYQEDQTRVGANLSLQWAPDTRNLFSLDGLYSYWGGTRQEQYLEAPGFSGTGKCSSVNCTSIANIKVLSDTISPQGVMTSGTFNGVDIRVEDRFDELHTNFDQLTLSGEHDLTDKLKMDEMIGASDSDFENPIQTTVGFDQYNIQGFSYNYNTRIPELSFGSANLTSAGPWVLTEVRERPQNDVNRYDTAQINFHYKALDAVTLSTGLSYKEYLFTTGSLRLVNGESVTSSNAYASLQAIPISSYSQGASLSGAGLNAPAGSATTWITPSVAAAQSVLGLYTNTALFALSDTGDLGDNAGVTEKDLGGYVQADFRTDVLGRTLRGNIGVRDVTTDQNSKGYSFVGGVQQAVTASRTYSNVLPSLNLAWDFRDDMVLRASAAKVMARPDLTSLVASTSVTVSGTSLTVKTGNPDLQPFLANAYDLAWEWYPTRGAIVSVALFRKDVQTFVTTQTENIPFHGNPFGIPDSAAIAACGTTPGCNASDVWSFSVPANTSGGTINGVEFNVEQPFTFLPGLLRHTGVLANFTAVDSNVNYPGATAGTLVSNQLLGLSRYSANMTLYYEDEHWSARVSGAFRSRYLTQVPGKETGTDADGFDSTFNLDASVQYTVNHHLKVTLEGVNLTDQYENEFDDTARDLSYYYHHTGPEILFGARYQY